MGVRSFSRTFLLLLLLQQLFLCYLAVPGSAFFGGRGSGGQRSAVEEKEEEMDYYAVLGLNEKATDREVRQKFRELSRKYHPDVANTEEARAMYSKISRANEVLSDKKKRRMYDMRGEEGLRQLERAAAQGDAGHAMDPLSRLFGMSSGSNVRGPNSEGSIHVTLEKVFTGGEESVVIEKQKVCGGCKGTGALPGGGMATCRTCGGNGVVLQRLQLGPHMHQDVRQTCPACRGRGRVAKAACRICGGARVVRGEVPLHLVVERGVGEGHTVVFEMEADESPDMVPGDLHISIHTHPHPRFSRRRNDIDLDTNITITLKEALLGFNKQIPHLDGTNTTVEATGVTPYGTVLRLRGMGMPKHNMPSERGDLYVKVHFELPKTLTQEQKKEIEELF
ncbi:putative chaperone DNAJ protein [Trypanosoma theileri]|uniref:Putative chaperone DNAJ protein n=1 Tax=Trypanosoma theileri TaxID=67003 RepID=A0A1X0NRT5_9TRYP|nr:putative chaperone DNAJ protein [Trypanosoma theileri]ORC87426.1 putative chaperone DNAJ protein [Trypanosoma theileri]